MTEHGKVIPIRRPEPPTVADESRMIVTLSIADLKQVVREVLAEMANGPQVGTEADRNLNPEEAAHLLGVEPRWLYRHAAKLPFARRLSRKVLRFSERGLMKWREAKRA